MALTGDLAIMDQEGYVTIVDRKKDMILTGGENVYSTEIENILYMHPAILECAVVGIPDPKWGEAVKGIVVLKPDQKATEDEIIRFCKDRIAHYVIRLTYRAQEQVRKIHKRIRDILGRLEKKSIRD
jgi:acyl-CoA synthetase (AMP-forming)/AMP-acid ligase II